MYSIEDCRSIVRRIKLALQWLVVLLNQSHHDTKPPWILDIHIFSSSAAGFWPGHSEEIDMAWCIVRIFRHLDCVKDVKFSGFVPTGTAALIDQIKGFRKDHSAEQFSFEVLWGNAMRETTK